MSVRREFTITKLERDEEGHWRARVTVDGVTYPVHRRFGSWMRAGDRHGVDAEVPKEWAFAIQDRVFPIERAERRAREKQTQAA